MSDKPESGRHEESASRDEVQRLTEEITEMKEMLKKLSMTGYGPPNPSTLNTSRQAAVGSDDGTDLEAVGQQMSLHLK